MIRNLFLITFVLICGISAKAQQLVSQKDLLGEWHVQAVAGQGIYYDFKKDNLGLSDSVAGLVKRESLPVFKKYVRETFEEEFGGITSFSADGKVRSVSKGKKQTDYYRLFVRDNVQYVSITSLPNGGDGEATIRMENGLLIMSRLQNDIGIISVLLSR